MSQQITLERIDLFTALKFGFVLGTFLALVGAVLFFMSYLWARAQLLQSPFFAPSLFNPSPVLPIPDIPAVLLILLVYIILGAVLYAFSVWLLAVIYNFVAGFSGGLIFQIKSASPVVNPQVAAPVAAAAAIPLAYNPSYAPANVTPNAMPPSTPATPMQPAPMNPFVAPVAAAAMPQAQPAANVPPAPLFVGVSNPSLRIALTKPVTRIGSGFDNDLVVSSARVAQHHAEIRYEGGRYILYDVSDGKGVSVNGRAIQQSNMLKNNFQVTLGDTTFVFQQ